MFLGGGNMSELAVNNENIGEVLKYRDRDITTRNKWVSVEPDDVYIISPETESELKEYISDWLALCPNGSVEKVKNYEKNLKKNLNKNGYKISELQSLIVKARFVAKIKKEYVLLQSELMKKAHENINSEFKGYTYLAEIARVLDVFLEQSEKDNPKLISICENKIPRRRV
jgi:hypothetical protein